MRPDQERAQTTGKLLIAGAALQMLLFLYGATRRSYLALALPVTAAMSAVTILTLWLGWTMLACGRKKTKRRPYAHE